MNGTLALAAVFACGPVFAALNAKGIWFEFGELLHRLLELTRWLAG